MSKIEDAARLYKQGASISGSNGLPGLADIFGVSPQTVRGYIYRMNHPDKYKECVQRYFAKLKANKQTPEAAEEKLVSAVAKSRKVSEAEVRAALRSLGELADKPAATKAKASAEETLKKVRERVKKIKVPDE